MSVPTITTEQAWTSWLAGAEARAFPDQDYARVVVVAAHPDDETLGASGLLQHLHERGAAVELVVATDGEAAFPAMSETERAALGRLRRTELLDSLRAQGMAEAPVHWLGLPDSGLAEHRAELTEALRDLLAGADLCLAPWPGDPHPDHQTVGDVALAAAPLTAHRWSYPIWMWHWLEPGDRAIPHGQAHTHRMTDSQRKHKAVALTAFDSQLRPGPNGEAPIVDADMLRHFDRDVEVFFRQPPGRTAPVDRFVELYDQDADPWAVADSWYERRKREVLLASLPEQHYGTVVEPACGNGILTRAVAGRAGELLAFDPVPAAVRTAGERTRDLANVIVTEGALPADLPTGGVDLVVFSEILYYLGDADLESTVDKAISALRPGGQLLAVHWLPWAPEAPRDGMAAHRFLLADPRLDRLVEHVDERFVLHVLGRR
ncbi:MAG TPA: bifunctional PIG-L family deacetylase/class I SAM-dependent methyltransferase [Pseudonocardiaceae bacterium]|jgi:LmbE family N-acetylglucosaminyl deacetylase|nr:bifunctional PIG-L family deacetylase/class I SAM-dependent methyltransferase [Pseudonocardiaceae bacterium]